MDPRSILLRDLGAFPRVISDLLTLEWDAPRGGFLLRGGVLAICPCSFQFFCPKIFFWNSSNAVAAASNFLGSLTKSRTFRSWKTSGSIVLTFSLGIVNFSSDRASWATESNQRKNQSAQERQTEGEGESGGRERQRERERDRGRERERKREGDREREGERERGREREKERERGRVYE